jgi:hypothetical protein
MPKIAVMLLADTETHEDMGRMSNALTLAKEGKEAGTRCASCSTAPARNGLPS